MLIRRFLAGLLVSLLAFAPAETIAPLAPPVISVSVAAAAFVPLVPAKAHAATTAHNAVVLSGIQSWSLPGSSADLYFALNAGSCAINRLALPCASLLSTTRASTGYGQWADGHYSSFGNNVPRITDQGLLVEQAATNLALQSGLPGGSAGNPPTSWSAFGSGMVPATAFYFPAGSAYAFTSSASRNFISQNIAVTSSTTYTFSAIVEANSGGIQIQELISIASLPAGASIAFPQGATTVPAAGTRIQVTLTVAGTSGSPQVRLGVGCNSNQTGSASLSIPQLETGSFPTSPILTTTGSATRAADVITLTGAAATAALAAKAMMAATNSVNFNVGAVNRIADYSGGSTIFSPSATQWRANDGTNSATGTIGGAATIASLVKAAFGLDNTSMTVIANGGTKNVQATSTWTTHATGTVTIGNRAAGDRALNGYMLRLTLGPIKGQFDALTN